MFTVNFFNDSAYPLKLVKTQDQSEHTVRGGAGVATAVPNVNVGDEFQITNLGDPASLYRPVFITDTSMTDVALNGNIPLRDQKLSILGIEEVDHRSNLFGVDIATFNPRRVVNSFAKKPIFEALSPDSIDYEFQSGKVIKSGLNFSGTHLSLGSSNVKMVYGYSSFAREWGINLGLSADIPLTSGGGSVSPGLDFSYNQFDNKERSSTRVYAYTREQRSVYEISIDPEIAQLSTQFVIDVLTKPPQYIIENYGTHYAEKVYYGGDRSLFATMSSDTYAKAKGFGMDLKFKLAVSKPGEQTTKVTGFRETTTTGNTDSSSPFESYFGFQLSENQQEREILQQAESGYVAIGGQGGFDGWQVTEANAVPVDVELKPLADLITARVFKNGMLDDVLASKKNALNQAIETYLKDKLQTLGPPLPEPQVYTVILKRLQVTFEADDLDSRTKGKIVAEVTPPQAGFDGLLWNKPNFDESDLVYRTGQFVTPNVQKTLVRIPQANGTFAPLQIRIGGNIEESDGAGDAERHMGLTPWIPITSNLAAGQELPIVFNLNAFTSYAERGTIQITAAVRREPSDFDNAPIARSRVQQIQAPPAAQPATPRVAQPVTPPAAQPATPFTPITNGVVGDFAGWAATSGVKIVTGDFSGNGRTDIALVNQGGDWATLPIAFSNGDGNFTITNHNVGDFRYWAQTSGVKIITGDFNGNGRTDIALVRQEPGWGTIPILFSNGDGTFRNTNNLVGDFASWAATSGVKIVTGDFNGNGRTDIALINQGGDWATLPIAFSNGDGSFTITNHNVGNFRYWAPTSGVKVITGDFNGNGRTDIALVRQEPGWGTIPIAFSNGDGNFTITNHEVGNFRYWAPTSGVKVITGDFNGNGRTDIALVRQEPGWGTVPILFSNGDGTFEITNNSAENFPGWAATSGVRLVPGDFRGNKQTDIALVRQEPGWGTVPVAFSRD